MDYDTWKATDSTPQEQADPEPPCCDDGIETETEADHDRVVRYYCSCPAGVARREAEHAAGRAA